MAKQAHKSNNESKRKRPDWKSGLWYFFIALVIFSVVSSYLFPPKEVPLISYTTFLEHVKQGAVESVVIRPSERLIIEQATTGETYKAYFIEHDALMATLQTNSVDVTVNPSDSGWVLGLLIQALFPFLLIAVFWFFIFKQAQGMNSQAMSFGKTKAKPQTDTKDTVTFNDVAGADEAVEELREIVDYLKDSKKFTKIGAKIPKGALLMGSPGTGKTLLARAVAGEADAQFFSISGSDFVEMFVGVGASRVRDLFSQAKKQSPSIIFLDEIDAVGRQRGAGLGGGHDEREQTLNQLLVEMDGFGKNEGVIVIAATNRPDILDPALLRPGRFDRQIVVDKPDLMGREAILAIHAKGKKFDANCQLSVLARATSGFTGADLANVLNEAALLAARGNCLKIDQTHVEAAMERVLSGPQRKSRIMNDKEKQIIAYHEVGHALVAHIVPGTDPVHKVTILPRGMALGYTLQLPTEDRYLISNEDIEAKIQVLMGGRIAEELVFKTITSGASNDIERATDLARQYVCLYGMSELGTRKYGRESQNVFLGRDYSDHSKDYSDQTSRQIDEAIQQLIEKNYIIAKKLLVTHRAALVTLSTALMEAETLDAVAFKNLADELVGRGSKKQAALRAPKENKQPASSQSDRKKPAAKQVAKKPIAKRSAKQASAKKAGAKQAGAKQAAKQPPPEA
ncbi:MAG: ATP-dependent zinc metalloprotease FtsH [Candidatus Marinamargulisbacteria bacterium]|nr:ATP-dependent zinc metalloprotease FtsH [Candidatus Marinamargulisbacteria bacterium]